MNLSQLYYFRELTDTRSYRKAAEQLYISQPTLSVAISNLEKELGTTLISRKRNGVELTEDGEEFSTCVSQALQILDEHVASIKRKSEERNSTLRIGIVFSAQSLVWSSIMRKFWMESREKPRYVIKQGTTPNLLDELKRGTVDVVIAGTMGEDEALVRIPCWSQQITAVVGAKSPLAIQKAETGITLDELRGFKVITYNIDEPLGPEITQLVKGHDLNIDFAYTDEITLCSLITAQPDTAVALACHSWLVESFSEVIPLELLDAPRAFHRFYLSHRANIPKNATLLRSFIDFVANFDFENVKSI